MSLGGFGDKLFEVSLDKIYTFSDYSNEISLNTEDQDVDGDKPSTYIKGMDLEAPSIQIKLIQSKNIDVQTEYNDWKTICKSGTPHMLFLGEEPVSTNKFLLVKLSASDMKISTSGKLIKVAIKLSFKEYVRKGVKK